MVVVASSLSSSLPPIIILIERQSGESEQEKKGQGAVFLSVSFLFAALPHTPHHTTIAQPCTQLLLLAFLP